MEMADKLTNAGLAIITNRIKGAGTEPNYVHWGTGTTAAAVTDTTLETAGAESRTSGTSTRVTTTATNDTYQVVGTITCTGSGKAITEMGLFDASTDGNLFTRHTFSAINVAVGDSIQFTAKTVYANAS
jgi:hypothetical protein